MTLLSSLSRRSFLALACAAPLASARAAGDVYLHAGSNFSPISIAVTPFAGDGASVSAVISNDLAHSVFLAPINAGSFPESITNPDSPPNFDAWKTVNAQFVLTGRASREGGRVTAQFRLWDTTLGQQVAGQQYTTEAANARRVGHMIADAVFTRVTGEKGFFDSRVVFVDESGAKTTRRKRIAVMDMDGANVRYLTSGDKLAVTPQFSPTRQQIAFMSFGDSDPRVTVLDLETGQRQPVGDFPGMTFSPRFAPDGERVLLSLSEGASANIYEMDLRSRSKTRLTEGSAIDTAPCFSPDGSQIVFESDRGGAQQLYIMSAGGGGARRISFGDGRYSTPTWSPRGDLIAFTRQKGGQFAIGVMKTDGSGERIITEGYHNEGPTFAPNGLFVMFFRDPGGENGARIFMSDIFGHGEFQVPTPGYASDPSWGPLLK